MLGMLTLPPTQHNTPHPCPVHQIEAIRWVGKQRRTSCFGGRIDHIKHSPQVTPEAVTKQMLNATLREGGREGGKAKKREGRKKGRIERMRKERKEGGKEERKVGFGL